MTLTATLTEPVRKRVNRTLLVLQKGDLTALQVDAVVFYAREDLELGSGFGAAIQTRGGDTVRKELERIGSIRMGEAVVTTAGQMNARYIIHACGPKFQEQDTEQKLRQCVLSSLKLADEKALKTIAFPPMGAGFYGVPLAVCAAAMIEAIRGFLEGETSLEEVIVCVLDSREFDAFKSKFDRL